MAFNLIISGDTHVATYANTSYPASTWALKYHLVGPSVLTVVAVADGDDFTMTLTAAQTTVLLAGSYSYAIRAYKDDTVYTLESGQVDVRPNPASATTSINIAQRMISLIEVALTGQLSDGEAMESLSISGRSISNISRLELIQERSFWYAELQKLRTAAQGGSGIRAIQLRAGRL